MDGDDPTPPYEQLRRQLADLIGAGVLPAGTRLPAVRQLASDLALASGTVARTYRELEQAGLVRARRSAGTTVSGGAARLSPTERSDRIAAAVRTAVHQARVLGASDDELLSALRRELR